LFLKSVQPIKTRLISFQPIKTINRVVLMTSFILNQ
jgi:hypothetical protein